MKEKINQTDAIKYLGITAYQFRLYRERLRIPYERRGRDYRYNKEDIERLKELVDDAVPALIATLERLTNKKVVLQ